MATFISGKEVSEDIKNNLKKKIEAEKVEPCLTIVQVGNREDSNVYIRMKVKFAEGCGVKTDHLRLDSNTTEPELIKVIDSLNQNSKVHGIIVQLPFDSNHPIDTNKICNLVSPLKDVDGLSDLNAGKLLHGQVDGKSCFLPCTPNGCMELIKRTGRKVEGARAVVIGRSKIVGSPMAQLLLVFDADLLILSMILNELLSPVFSSESGRMQLSLYCILKLKTYRRSARKPIFWWWPSVGPDS